MKLKTDYNYALNNNLIGSYDLKTDVATFLAVPDYMATAGKVYTKSGLESEESKPAINVTLTKLASLSVEITTDFLAADFKGILPIASKDETRLYLLGVYIDSSNNAIVATDGCIMRITKVDHVHHAQDPVIIPSAAIKEALNGKGKFLTLSKLEEGYYSLTCGTIRVIFKPTEREYPKYANIIPNASKLPNSVVIDSETLAWIRLVCKSARADKVKIPVITLENGSFTALGGKMQYFAKGYSTAEHKFTFNAFLGEKVLEVGDLYFNTFQQPSLQITGLNTNILIGVRE